MDEVRCLVNYILDYQKIKTDLIEVSLVTEEKISEIHKKLFDDPSPTDCISCPYDDPKIKNPLGEHFLGEIFVSPKAAILYNSQDPYTETTLYIIHSILHLLGYDDIKEKDRKLMENKQQEILSAAKEKKIVLTKPIKSID